jgi:hypothetical protein
MTNPRGISDLEDMNLLIERSNGISLFSDLSQVRIDV